ncbi:serpin family protein [bacterium]|nr:serpin family protein [bacterium]
MRRLVLSLVPSVLIGLAGCQMGSPAGNPVPPGPPPVEWSAEMQAVADGNNWFALDLYAKLRGMKGNLFFSPYSAHTALAMTAAGAKGATRDQTVTVLHLPAEEQKAGASGDLGRFYAHPREDYELSVANALWGQKGYPWRPEFLDLQRTRFGAGFREADFATDPEAERKRINGWVEEQTRDRIKELLRERLITNRHRMVLVNAVYFKGAWKDQFDPKQTRPLPFTQADGTKTPVPMMHREGGFRHYVEPRTDGKWGAEFQVAELPYKGGELSMVVLLPGTHDGLPALEAKLTADALAGWLAKAKDAGEADLDLPKFRIETDAMMLKDPLQQLGMVAAFDPFAADFTGLHTGGEQLFVDFVVQKAFVDVNEEGTEAAAATAVGVRGDSARRGFQADHPFLFLIRDTQRGTILFLGRVEKP